MGLLGLTIPTLISRVIVLIVAFTVHEFSHAAVAEHFGDDTPRLNGRLTLNPIVHLDPMGSLLLLVSGFGWAKPVPVNPYALGRRSSAAMMWVSLAGPLSNLLMAIVGAVPFRLGLLSLNNISGGGPILPTPAQVMFDFIEINLVLLLFNLIPLAPLDGEKIFDYFLPPSWANALESIRPYGPIILIALVFVGPMIGFDVLNILIGRPLYYLMRLLIR